MSMLLTNRVSALENTVKELRATIDGLIAVMSEPPESEPKANPNGPRQLCPKCHEVPAYYLHVKHCRGKKQAAAI